MTPVRVYAHDVLPQANARGEHWLYVGILVIDKWRHAEALTALGRDRTDAGYHLVRSPSRSSA